VNVEQNNIIQEVSHENSSSINIESAHVYPIDDILSNIDFNDDVLSNEEKQNYHSFDDSIDTRNGKLSYNYNLRPRRARNCDHLFVNSSSPINTPRRNIA
jgi:hypothetical protein